MTNTTILQIPINKVLKQKATIVASDLGFSSLQEMIRVIIVKIAKRELVVTITDVHKKSFSSEEEKRHTNQK